MPGSKVKLILQNLNGELHMFFNKIKMGDGVNLLFHSVSVCQTNL